MKVHYSKVARTFALLLLITCAHTLHAQPTGAIYANSQSVGGTGGTITGETNAIVANETFAVLTASRFVTSTAIPVFTLTFADEIVSSSGSPSTVYLRVNGNSNALAADAITLEAVNTSNSVVGSGYTTYYTGDGKVFLGITPTANYKSIRITVTPPGLVGSRTLQVYYAFRPSSPSNSSNPYPFNSADCGQPNATTKEFSGQGIGSFDVSNAGYAIDDQVGTKSSFVSTGLFTSGHIKQIFLFNGQSNSRDAVRVVLSQSGSFVKANLAASVTLRAYNGSATVGTSVLMSTLLDVALLDILGVNDSQLTFFYAPKESDGSPVIFDRIEIDLNIAGLGVGLGAAGVNIHDIRRVPDEASINASDLKACTNVGTVALSALSLQKDILNVGTFSYAWYTAIRSGTLLSSASGWTDSGLTSVGTKTYYVETLKSGTGCGASPRKKVTVTIQAAPILPTVSLTP